MPITSVNIGSAPNTGEGDPLRIAFDKLNSNFTEVSGLIVGKEDVSNKGDPNGYAALDGSGYVPNTQISPDVARLQLGTTQTFTGTVEFDKKVLFPPGSGTVTASVNIPNSSGNVPIAGDLYAQGGELKWHDGTTVRTLSYSVSTVTLSFARTFLHMGA